MLDFKIGSMKFFDSIVELEDDKLFEFLESITSVINELSDSQIRKSGFNFVANSSLSGLPFPCQDFACRIGQIMSLARNSILYADTVYIQNPFEHHLNYRSFNKKQKLEILTDLSILHIIYPLLKEGIFRFTKSELHFCHDCYKNFQEAYLKDFDWNIKIIENLVEEYIYQKVDFHLILSYGKKCVEISGGNDFLDHPIIISFVEYIPKPLDSIVIRKKSRIKLTPEEIKESGVLYYILEDIIRNITTQDYYSKYLSAHVLTNREFDIKLFNLINDRQILIEDNYKKTEVLKNLNHYVPFINTISITKLIKLRKNEGEAFEVYRDKLNSIVKLNNMSSNESKDYYNDEIRPELNKINLTIKNNRKLLWGNVKTNLILASTYVSASLYSGILPSNIGEIVASIGGFGFASSISHDMIKIIKKPSIRENELYFLWKLNSENKIKI